MAGNWWSKIAATVLSLWVALLVAPSAAPAAGNPEVGGYGFFKLEASHGYSVLVLAESRKDYKQGEIFLVARGKGGVVLYATSAEVTDTKIKADLGALGRIDVEFQPSGAKGSKACEGEEIPYDKGSYVGTIEFHGEEGYTDLSATRARFTLEPLINSLCGGFTIFQESSSPHLPGAGLNAKARLRNGSIALKASQNHPGARVSVRAEIKEKRGEVQLLREVGLSYPASAFHFDPKLRSASLNPPAPFSGSAVFHRHAKPANRWTGSLSVDFPGRSNVSLAGARFRARLYPTRFIRRTVSPQARRPTLSPWLSTKPSPTAFATSSLLAPR
jgi:hypothetical protein